MTLFPRLKRRSTRRHRSSLFGLAKSCRRVVPSAILAMSVLVAGALAGCQVVVSRTQPAARAVPQERIAQTSAAVNAGTQNPRAAEALPTPTATPQPTPQPTQTIAPPLVAQSPPSRITAPSIGLDAPVVPIGWHEEKRDDQMVSVWDVADYAAGWHKNSVYPGQRGNVVLSGHHNIAGEVFRYVVDLKPGDRVTLYADGVPYVYVVSLRLIVPEKGVPPAQRLQNVRWIGPTSDARLTLVTCWPYTNNTHRVIVVAKLLDRGQLAANK